MDKSNDIAAAGSPGDSTDKHADNIVSPEPIKLDDKIDLSVNSIIDSMQAEKNNFVSSRSGARKQNSRGKPNRGGKKYRESQTRQQVANIIVGECSGGGNSRRYDRPNTNRDERDDTNQGSAPNDVEYPRPSSRPANIIELMTELHKPPQKPSLAKLRQLIGYDIGMRIENIPGTSVITSSADDTQPLIPADYATRVILTSRRPIPDWELSRQCNGLVLDAQNWRVLAVPPPCIQPTHAIPKDDQNAEPYKLYDAEDGSTITLYWYDNEWRFSSAGGFDVGEYTWLHPAMTYKEVFLQLTEDLYPNWSLDLLESSYCYSFGFHHPSFHPLGNYVDVWFIQRTDLFTLETDCPEIEIPSQKQMHPVENIDTYLNQALADAIENIDNNVRFCHGVIAKSGTNWYIVESPLRRELRRLVYDVMPKHPQIKMSPQRRIEFIILNACMYNNTPTGTLFQQLFPFWVRRYNTRVSQIKNIITTAVVNMQTGRMPANTITGKLSAKVAEIARAHEIDPKSPEAEAILCDFMFNANNLNILTPLLFVN